jgi:hypothetical protein
MFEGKLAFIIVVLWLPYDGDWGTQTTSFACTL